MKITTASVEVPNIQSKYSPDPGSHKDFILHIAADKQLKLTAQEVRVCQQNHLHKSSFKHTEQTP